MWRRLLPLFIGLGVIGLLVYQLISEGAVECRLCVTFAGMRQCATAHGPDEKAARAEAQNTACARMMLSTADSAACPNAQPDELKCQKR